MFFFFSLIFFSIFFFVPFHGVLSLKNALVSHFIVIKSPIRARKKKYYHWLECATWGRLFCRWYRVIEQEKKLILGTTAAKYSDKLLTGGRLLRCLVSQSLKTVADEEYFFFFDCCSTFSTMMFVHCGNSSNQIGFSHVDILHLLFLLWNIKNSIT